MLYYFIKDEGQTQASDEGSSQGDKINSNSKSLQGYVHFKFDAKEDIRGCQIISAAPSEGFKETADRGQFLSEQLKTVHRDKDRV